MMLKIETGLPEELGISSEAILRFLKRLDECQIPMHSVQLMRRDKLIFEGYYAPCKKGELHRMFSVSKSFTALAIIKLAEEGRIDLETPVIEYFPEYFSEDLHPWIRQTTIRNMLEMRTCHSATTYKRHIEKNWVESFFVIPPDHKPGTVFHYDTSSAHTMCALVEKLTGKPMLEYLKDVVLREIGFSEEAYMLRDPFGTSMGGSGLMATAEDLLRVGILLMHKGEWNGRQLLDRELLEKATSCRVETMVKSTAVAERSGYGYQIWMGSYDSFLLMGMGGQLVICLPKQELLCVTTADDQGIGGGNRLILDSFYGEILSGLSAEKLPQNEKAFGELHEYAKTLHIRPLRDLFDEHTAERSLPKENELEERSLRVNGKTYRFQDNGQGFERMSITLAPSGDGKLTFVLKGKSYSVRFGYTEVLTDRFPIHDMKCASSGIWLDESTFYIRTFLLDEACGSIHFQLYFGEDDLTVFMKKDDEMLFGEFVGHLYGKAVETAD